MRNLICSMAGRSTRFNGTRPKGLLTHPNGCSMLTESIRGIVEVESSGIYWDNIYVVYVKSQMELEVVVALGKELEQELGRSIKFIELSDYTKNQPHTIYEAITTANIAGSIFIKDCDNHFNIANIPLAGNGVSVCKLGNEKLVAGNKSYVQFDQLGNINNIVEKQIVSDTFCCGGYYFESANEFCAEYESLANEENLYISHIIFNMILKNQKFSPIYASNYIDWGTLDDWLDYTKQFKTIFIDLDGVIFKNAGKLTFPSWNESDIIKENVEMLKSLDFSKVTLIATSSRPESMKVSTLGDLNALGIKVSYAIFGLPHCKRILVNDFATTNPYPSAQAINTKRDDILINLKGV